MHELQTGSVLHSNAAIVTEQADASETIEMELLTVAILRSLEIF